ncbi:glycosyl transferase family 2 [Bacteroidia bacterium]|nr:glycosyl transferase family 2 [Bacteroidia bacterium]GHT85810.1 glycosyl transferase family 2 [Bacteroidia bacterium]
MLFTTIEIALLSILAFSFIAQLIFYWSVLRKPYSYLQSVETESIPFHSKQPPVSIIICVKNDYDLQQFLPAILEQDYPEFEVIIVNDGFSDANEETLTLLKNQYANLYSTYIPEDTKNISRKKLGLTLGIKAAKYDHLLFTEADGQVRTSHWISLMTRHFSDKKSIVLGFSALQKKKGFFAKFRAYDYFFSNLQMISLALLRHPYAGSGRNLAYAKNHFNAQKGFVKHRILQQGEDDLFVNEISNKENTAVELSSESLIVVDINNHLDWKKLKIDRSITHCFYKPGPIALWRLESWLRMGFILSFAVCLIFAYPYSQFANFLLAGIALFCFFVRLFSQIFVVNQTAKRLKLEKFYFTLPFFDLFQPFVNISFYIYRIFKRKKNYTNQYETRM